MSMARVSKRRSVPLELISAPAGAVAHHNQPSALALGERALAVDRSGHMLDLLFDRECTPGSVQRPARRVAPPAARHAAPVDEAAQPENSDVAARRVGELLRGGGVEPRHAGVSSDEEDPRAVTTAGVAQHVEVLLGRPGSVEGRRERSHGHECTNVV